MKTALIFGVSGQDGAYLSRFLVDRDYAVHGTSRDAAHPFARLHTLGVRDRVTTHCLATTDAAAVRTLIDATQPDEIYNLAGLSSVAQSFADPAAAWSSVVEAQAVLLDAVRDIAPRARLYHSASSECFGNLAALSSAYEATPFAPCSPYAEAKAASFRATREAREAHALFACSGLVFNHESPLRPPTFVSKKIISAASAIAAGADAKLQLGDLTASRDWGYAPEYVEAMWLMLQQDEPRDYVLATGESHTVEEFAAAAFAAFDLDWREHVTTDDSLLRRAEIRYNRGDATRAREELGWEARTKFDALVRCLTDAELTARAGQ